MTRDESWISGIYEYADITPSQLAKRLGRSQESVIGKYNPKDDRHNPSDRSTWTINSFKDIRMTAKDGDGNSISPYSNVLEIMSMANLYTYYKGPDNYDLFLEYAEELWKVSHSYRVSMSDIYYCSGCLSEEAEQREMEALEAEAIAEEMGQTEVTSDASQGEENQAAAVSAAAEETSADHTEGTEENQEAASVIIAGVQTAERKAQKEAEAAAAAAASEAVPESTSAVISVPDKQKDSGPTAEREAAVEAESSETAESESTGTAESEAAPEGLTDNPDVSDTAMASPSNLQPDVPVSPEAGDAESQQAPDEAADSSEKTEKTVYSDCPGHVDLVIHMEITGMNEKQNNLFAKDPIGNDESNIDAEEGGWKGWGSYATASARLLSKQDWFEKYGLSVSSISSGNPLTKSEIEAYMMSLPEDLSDTRKNIIRYALESVGKIPYYWGGKPSGPGYSANRFNVLTAPDYKGRVLKGLDCSGWINWVYWSATGKRLPYESTSGLAVLGRKISRKDLQPGDIIVRTGTEAHVIMFLGWTADGRIQCIHESSGPVNNVTVSVRDANWPYCRNLVD